MKRTVKSVTLLVFGMMFLSINSSCQKKDFKATPGIAPGLSFFTFGSSHINQLKDKKIIIQKLDATGNIVANYKVEEVIPHSDYGYLFRIGQNWADVKVLFNAGVNTFKLVYPDNTSDILTINASYPSPSINVIKLDSVKYNNQHLSSRTSSQPASDSNIYLIK